MAKLGRNDKCHCGSGKKYKKCCLDKDQEQAKSNPKAYRESLLEDGSALKQISDEQSLDELSASYAKDDLGFSESCQEDDPDSPFYVPDITAEEDNILVEWINEYDSLATLTEKFNSLKAFLAEHPELEAFIGAETEVLLNLEEKFSDIEESAQYIQVLLSLRNDFPKAYLQVFEYLDKNIICHLIVTGETHKIDEYLKLYRDHPTHDPELVDKLLRFFVSLGMFEFAHKLAKDIYKPLYDDPEIETWIGLMQILIMGCYGPYLDSVIHNQVSEQTIEDIKNCLKPYEREVPGNWFSKGYLNNLAGKIFVKSDTKWTLEDCSTAQQVLDVYDEMLYGFMNYLSTQKKLHWAVADYYRMLISDFIWDLIPDGKVSRKFLPLTEKTLREKAVKLSKKMFGISPVIFFSAINGLYLLTDYLLLTDSIDKNSGDAIKSWCKKLHDEQFDNKQSVTLGMLPFKPFPLF